MINCRFIEGALNLVKISKNNASCEIGATAIFEGTVRADRIKDQQVIAIYFSTQEKIAKELSLKLITEFIEKFDLLGIQILHSIGKVNTGDICFKVIVSAAHRKEAFEALPLIVTKFKKTVPIFGKEILEDESYVWKENK